MNEKIGSSPCVSLMSLKNLSHALKILVFINFFFCCSTFYSAGWFLLWDKSLVLVCFLDLLAFLKESICPCLSKLLACQTCLGKYDCKYENEV